jgi:hypothetical protein
MSDYGTGVETRQMRNTLLPISISTLKFSVRFGQPYVLYVPEA